MLTMMRSSLVLYLLFAAAAISDVVGQDCAFIPGPITASNDTVVTTVDCYRRHGDDAGLGDTTGDNTGLVVYLYNCTTVPVGLFVDVSSNLSTVTVMSKDSEVLLKGTFEGLGNIAELRLEGFQTLRSLSSAVFRPLRNLERLVLVGFGAHMVTYADLGAALYELSGTPLRRIVMHKIHSIQNEKDLNVNILFRMQNVSIRELSFSNNIVSKISGRLSRSLPDLNYICGGGNPHFYAAMNALLDVWLFLSNINEILIYAYPVPDTLNTMPSGGAILIRDLDLAILRALAQYLGHDGCYSKFKLPLTPSLRRLTIRNFQMLDAVNDKPICFANNNNIEYLDMAGSILPTNTTKITGLDRLKHFKIQNTGIIGLPDDFLRYFPKLETINLGQLSIAEFTNHIKSSFFGNCPTLREIHMGDCQLTTIPPTAFELLPSLETLNLSSNSLRMFDISLSNSSNLWHLNLSSNAISTIPDNVLVELDEIAHQRLQVGEMLTIDLRRNQLSCLCNSTHFVKQLRKWIKKQEVNVPDFENFTCLYPNGSVLAMSQVDMDQCGVLNEVMNGSNCPCDNHLRQRLELVTLSLHGYVCRNAGGKLVSMAVYPLPSCHVDFYRSASFIAPVVVGGVLAVALVVSSIVLYRHRKDERLHRILGRLGMNHIVRLGIQYVMAQNREDPNNFEYDVFLYIQDNDWAAADRCFDTELSPYRHILRHDDFRAGLKVETLLEDMWTCRWLVPVLSPNFVDDGECCDFIARAQYSRPHAIVPVVWTEFQTDNLTINSLLDTAEPVTWPGDMASDGDKAMFWKTLLERTGVRQTSTV